MDFAIGRSSSECTSLINHARAAFIENKRYRKEQPACDDVVNRKRAFVYQTDAI